MRSAPHLDFAGEVRAATNFPVFHAARIADVATARHAIATGKLDMVGMTRAHIADPHIVEKVRRARSTASAPASAPPIASTASMRAARRCASTMPRTGREATMPHVITEKAAAARKVVVVSAPGRRGWRRRGWRPNAATR
jgi:N-methyl-L-proline demethylase